MRWDGNVKLLLVMTVSTSHIYHHFVYLLLPPFFYVSTLMSLAPFLSPVLLLPPFLSFSLSFLLHSLLFLFSLCDEWQLFWSPWQSSINHWHLNGWTTSNTYNNAGILCMDYILMWDIKPILYWTQHFILHVQTIIAWKNTQWLKVR